MFKKRDLNLDNIKREWHLVPPVSRVNFTNFRYNSGQRVKDFQVALHLNGTPDQVKFNINGQSVEVGHPHLLVKRPGDELSSSGGQAQSIYFKYGSEVWPDFPADLICCEISLNPGLDNSLHKLYDLLEHGLEFGVADQIDALSLEIITGLLVARRDVRIVSHVDWRIREAASYMHTHLSECGNLNLLARKFGFSRRNFDRRWQQELGCAPGQSLHELKLAEAEKLLLETELDISQIAGQLGYNETTNFIAAFRRNRGVTPLQYRRKFVLPQSKDQRF